MSVPARRPSPLFQATSFKPRAFSEDLHTRIRRLGQASPLSVSVQFNEETCRRQIEVVVHTSHFTRAAAAPYVFVIDLRRLLFWFVALLLCASASAYSVVPNRYGAGLRTPAVRAVALPPDLGVRPVLGLGLEGEAIERAMRVREAAKSLTHHQHANHSVFSYFFTHTPTYSANYEHLPSLGAFHGAEVPFAFSFPDELSNDAERQLASRMGCAWRNFAASGDPNVGPSPCLSGEAPVAWPRFVGGMEPHDQPTLIFDVNSTSVVYGLKDEQCDAFGLSSARAQAAPWPRQLRTGRK